MPLVKAARIFDNHTGAWLSVALLNPQSPDPTTAPPACVLSILSKLGVCGTTLASAKLLRPVAAGAAVQVTSLPNFHEQKIICLELSNMPYKHDIVLSLK